ncbi:MAG TPA: monovalent cation/H(+) antiporter subunit G [Balneolales bacterium]|nr:monovalent cation/H(+) antiporter subunit G [Balneolales bacterium]
MNSIIAVVLLSTGVLFNLLGCIGLIRLPDVYNRLQSATKCVTLGTCSILLGLLVMYGFNDIGVKALISIPLLFFSATVAAHALVRGAYLSGVKMDKRTVVDHYKAVRDGVAQSGNEKEGREEELYEVS